MKAAGVGAPEQDALPPRGRDRKGDGPAFSKTFAPLPGRRLRSGADLSAVKPSLEAVRAHNEAVEGYSFLAEEDAAVAEWNHLI